MDETTKILTADELNKDFTLKRGNSLECEPDSFRVIH